MQIRISVVANTLLGILVTSANLGSSASADDGKKGAAPGVPELKVLEKLIGSWDEVAELPDGSKIKAIGSAKWVLGGTHIQSTYSISLADGSQLEHLTLMSWDSKKKVYRSWMFSSSGDPLESTGAWDQEAQTLTFESKPNARGVTISSSTRFTSDDKLEWSVEGKDKSGKTVFSMKGIDTRKQG